MDSLQKPVETVEKDFSTISRKKEKRKNKETPIDETPDGKKNKETPIDERHDGKKTKRFMCGFCSYTTKKLSHLEKHLTGHENVESSTSAVVKKGLPDSSALIESDQLVDSENVRLPKFEMPLKSIKKKRHNNQVSASKVKKSNKDQETEDHVQEFARQSNQHISGPGSDETWHMQESVKKKKQKRKGKNRDAAPEENCASGLKLMETQNLVESSNETVNDNKKVFVFRCSSCDFETDSKKRFVRHRAKHAFYCTECDFSADAARTVQEHFSHNHKRKGKYNCPECDLTNDSSWGLKMHMKTHSSDKSLFCEFCNFSTRWPFALKRHIACTHPTDDSKRFHCNHCAYGTNSRSDLKRHIRTHSTIKPYSCSICPHKCKSANSLRRHIIIHVQVKKYACDLCEYTCAGIHNLTLHQKRVHSDDNKPYKCSHCKGRFWHIYQLRQHEVLHSENKPRYKCSNCEKTFSRRYDCRQHEFKCAGISMYTCPVCNEGFWRKKYLQKHIVVHSSL